MLNKFDQLLLKAFFWLFYKLSCHGKNGLGTWFFFCGFCCGLSAYFYFSPQFDNLGYGFEYGKIHLFPILIGRSGVGWIFMSLSVFLIIAGTVSTYIALRPGKSIDYEKYLYPLDSSDRKEDDSF